MGMTPSSRIPARLTTRVANAVAQRAGTVTGRGPEPENRTTRRRFELLDLSKVEDQQRWQMLHNDSERYKIVEAKYNHMRTDIGVQHSCLVIYDEIGDNLPLVRAVSTLRSDDSERLRADAQPPALSFEAAFEDGP